MKFLGKIAASEEDRPPTRHLYFAVLLVVGIMALMTGTILILRFKPVPHSGAAWIADPVRESTPDRLDPMRKTVAGRLDSFNLKRDQGRIDLEDLEFLEETLDLQQEVIRAQGRAAAQGTDLAQLEVLLDTFDQEMGSFWKIQSIRLEEEAMAHHKRGELALALEALEGARNLQKRINDELRRSEDRDASRQHQLENRILDWQTKPIAERADRLLEEALKLRESLQYAEAIKRVDSALQHQQRLNQEFRASPYALHSRLKQFEQVRDTIQAAESVDKLRDLMDSAQSMLDAGQPAASLEKAREAGQLHELLNGKYRYLPEIPESTRKDLAILTDTAASVTAFRELERQANDCRQLLREKNLESFANVVSVWLRTTRGFLEEYPDSKYVLQVNLEEVRFLHERRDFLPNILDTVYANLVPLGDGATLMYRTEVPQFLYELVTRRNPSHNRGNLLPVDSVTWEEARRFVDLMGWILAKPVSLPTRDQYMMAVSAASLKPGQVWSSMSSGRETRDVASSEPDSSGFYDLLGNVAEWMDAPEVSSTGQAPLFGGSARDDFETLLSLTQESRSINERLRFAGFRFIVHESE